MKSGEILICADVLDSLGEISDVDDVIARRRESQGRPISPDDYEVRRGSKAGHEGRKSLADYPILHVDLVKAQNLIKTDMIGKSDPYAVLKYGDQKDKTNVVKNTQNPQWDHSSDFTMDPLDDTNLM